MSPQAALASDIFRAYFFLATGLLVTAGLVLSLLRWGFKKQITSIWLTYQSWLIMAPLTLGAVFSGRVTVIVFFCVLAALGFKEFARATGLYRDWWLTGAVYVGIIAVGVTSLVRQPQGLEPSTGWYGLFIVLPVYAVALIMLIPILRNQVQGQLQQVSLAIVGFIYIGWMFGHLAFLANATNAYGYLLYVVFATELNDVAAFTFGQALWQTSIPQQHQSQEDLGRRARGAGGFHGIAVVAAVFLSAIRRPATGAGRLDRRYRRADWAIWPSASSSATSASRTWARASPGTAGFWTGLTA